MTATKTRKRTRVSASRKSTGASLKAPKRPTRRKADAIPLRQIIMSATGKHGTTTIVSAVPDSIDHLDRYYAPQRDTLDAVARSARALQGQEYWVRSLACRAIREAHKLAWDTIGVIVWGALQDGATKAARETWRRTVEQRARKLARAHKRFQADHAISSVRIDDIQALEYVNAYVPWTSSDVRRGITNADGKTTPTPAHERRAYVPRRDYYLKVWKALQKARTDGETVTNEAVARELKNALEAFDRDPNIEPPRYKGGK